MKCKDAFIKHTNENDSGTQLPTGVKIEGENMRNDLIFTCILFTFSKVSRSMLFIIF